MSKAIAKKTELGEYYETHAMSELAIIFHSNKVVEKEQCFLNWHENIELLYFKEGEAAVYRNGERMRARAGDIMIFPANCMHGVASCHVVYDCLIIDRGLSLSAGVDTSALSFPALVRDRNLAALLLKVGEEKEREDDGYRVCAVRGAVFALLAYLGRHYATRREESDSRSVEGIKKALAYIRDRIGEPITVDALAKVAGFSKFHFSREFKRVSSYTVVTYLNLLRIEKAKGMLSSGEHTVSETAEECGFHNLSYFSKTFREQTGITPSEYLSHRKK